MRKTGLLCVVALAALSTGRPALPHHSFAAVFDDDQPVEFTGTVTRVEWLNPHVWFYIDVENADGGVDNWAFEMGSPNRLQRYGWHQDSMPPGLMVTVTGSRARDGSMKAAVDTVILEGGRVLFGAQDASQ